MTLPSALSSQPRSALANSRRSEKSSFSYHSAFFSAVIAVASSISPGWGESLKMSVIKFRLFSSVLPAACAVRDAPQANAATAEVERKFLRVISTYCSRNQSRPVPANTETALLQVIIFAEFRLVLPVGPHPSGCTFLPICVHSGVIAPVPDRMDRIARHLSFSLVLSFLMLPPNWVLLVKISIPYLPGKEQLYCNKQDHSKNVRDLIIRKHDRR